VYSRLSGAFFLTLRATGIIMDDWARVAQSGNSWLTLSTRIGGGGLSRFKLRKPVDKSTEIVLDGGIVRIVRNR
jgi:hypothetical protein